MRKTLTGITIGLLAIVGIVWAAEVTDVSTGKVLEHKKIILNDAITVDCTTSNQANAGGVKVYDFPPGVISVHGVFADNLKVTTTSAFGWADTDPGDLSIGTTVGTGTGISGTEVDLGPSTAHDYMTNLTDVVLADAMIVDGSTTASDMYINLLLDANTVGAGIATGKVSGTVIILYSVIGDD